MKKLILLTLLVTAFAGFKSFAQVDKSKRVSPPALVTQSVKKGPTITIDYSRPSVKGRTLGTDLAPFGKVWRTGANEATVFEISKDAKIEGQILPAGKYSLYTIPGENEWVIIFNKTWKQWGTDYNQATDQLRITVKPEKAETFVEQMTFEIAKTGEVSLLWGNVRVPFKVK